MSAEKKLRDAFREFHACSEREQKYMIKKYFRLALESMGSERFSRADLENKAMEMLCETITGAGPVPGLDKFADEEGEA